MSPDLATSDLRVSVCICTRNRGDELREALASIAASTLRPAQVVVSDDSDSATTAKLSAGAVPVTYVRGPQTGLGANRNSAIAAATSQHLLFLDDDARLGPDFLEKVARRLAAVPESVRPRTIITGTEINRGRTVRPNEQDMLGFQSRRYRPGEPLRTAVINAALFPRRLFEEVRFDPSLRYGFDEVDVTTQAVACGYSILPCFEASNLHLPSESGRDYYNGAASASRLYVTLKRRRWTERSPLRAWAGFALASAHLCLAGIKRSGPRDGITNGVATIRQALTQYATFRQFRGER